MDDVALTATKAALEASNWWAGWCTITVAVGVFIEFVVLFIFSKEMDWREKSTVAFASALIVIGVAGEWWFGGKAADAADQLQADATGKAANANSNAAKANERAARLENEAAAANLRAAEIMRATAWRQFTRSQTSVLANFFSTNSGKLSVGWSPNDTEALWMAIQFSNILNQDNIKQRWDITPLAAPGFVESVVWGIDIPDMPNAKETVAGIRKSFSDAGVPFQTIPLPTPQSGVFFGGPPAGRMTDRAIIFFGSKAPTFAQPPF